MTNCKPCSTPATLSDPVADPTCWSISELPTFHYQLKLLG
jgi:hypothetical protein